MKEYKSNEALIEYLSSKGVMVLNKKLIDENYIKSDNITNLYMVIRCMEKLLTKEQYEDLYNSICEEIVKLGKKLKSIEVSIITKIMGFPMIKINIIVKNGT